jgi:hypothetical protein
MPVERTGLLTGRAAWSVFAGVYNEIEGNPALSGNPGNVKLALALDLMRIALAGPLGTALAQEVMADVVPALRPQQPNAVAEPPDRPDDGAPAGLPHANGQSGAGRHGPVAVGLGGHAPEV